MIGSVSGWAVVSTVTALLAGAGLGVLIGCFISSPLMPEDKGDI